MPKEGRIVNDYCLGHLTRSNAPWCDVCTYDDGNRQCHGYQPIRFVIVEVLGKGIERCVEEELKQSA